MIFYNIKIKDIDYQVLIKYMNILFILYLKTLDKNIDTHFSNFICLVFFNFGPNPNSNYLEFKI